MVWRNTGLPTITGRKVGGMLLDAETRGLTVDITIHHAAADGDVVLTDRTDVLRKGKWETSFWVRGTFEVRDGKITCGTTRSAGWTSPGQPGRADQAV